MSHDVPMPWRAASTVIRACIGVLVLWALPAVLPAQGATSDDTREATREEPSRPSRESLALRAITGVGLPASDMRLGEIPAFSSLNPSMLARSGVLSEPFRLPRPGWSIEASASYANIIEYDYSGRSVQLLDAEVARVALGLRRDVARDAWVSGSIGITAAHNGHFDGFLDWYHERIGFPMWERDERPTNVFADTLILNGKVVRAHSRGSTALSDVRLSGGLRWSPAAQTVLTVTLPTAPSSSLDHRGVGTVNAIQTFRRRISDRALVELSGGVGYSARSGPASSVQRRWNAGGSLATRLRMTGGHALYGLVFYHSSPYVSTGLSTQDSGELSTDFGYVYRWADGRELRLGLTEDIYRLDQGVDVGVRLSFVR